MGVGSRKGTSGCPS